MHLTMLKSKYNLSNKTLRKARIEVPGHIRKEKIDKDKPMGIDQNLQRKEC